MNRIRGFGSHLAFMWDRNLIRLMLVLAVITAIIAANGTIGFLQMIVGVIGSAPAFALQLSFAATYIIFQFGILFWFLSRPRKYTVTPDDPQIGLSFEDYRGQPDLLEHAKTTVGILRGVKEFELRGGEMPKGMLLAGAPGTGKTFLAACIAKEANLPFIYIDSSSLQGMFVGMSQLMIMKLFRDARGLARKYAEPGRRGACILFMDELDSIGQSRGSQTGGMFVGGFMGGGSMGLNTLLNQMDSLGELVEDRWRFKILRWFGVIRGPRPHPTGSARPNARRPRARRRWPPRHHRPLPLDQAARPRDPDGAARQRLDGLDPDHDQDDHQRGAHPGASRRTRVPHVQGLAGRGRRARARAQAADPLVEPH